MEQGRKQKGGGVAYITVGKLFLWLSVSPSIKWDKNSTCPIRFCENPIDEQISSQNSFGNMESTQKCQLGNYIIEGEINSFLLTAAPVGLPTMIGVYLKNCLDT